MTKISELPLLSSGLSDTDVLVIDHAGVTYQIEKGYLTALSSAAVLLALASGAGATNGQLLIGSSGPGGFVPASLTAGTGVTITPGAGSITISAPDNGTVSSVAATDANGFNFTIANPTSTPDILLEVSVSGMLKGATGALVAATAGTDYSAGTNSLATGILKSTTGTGALTIAVASDFPTLNQNTTGSAGSLVSTVANTITLNSASAGLTITQAGAGAALTANAQIVSTLATGTAPFSVASTTNVANLNASSLSGATFAVPGTIGGGTPGAATFTTLTATGQVSLGGAAGAEGLRCLSFASLVNRWQLYGNTTGSPPRFYVEGSDTNIAGQFSSKGVSQLDFLTNTFASLQFRVSHTASAVNYSTVAGAVTGGFPFLFFTGSDANVNGGILTKGTGGVGMFTNSGNQLQAYFSHTASAVNYPLFTGSATGNAIPISAAGSDSNIDLSLLPKGTGNVRMGTHSAIAAETVTGYITIKDAGGTVRKLAVVS